MPTRCVIAGCSNTLSEGVTPTCRLPKDEALRKIWATKVQLTRAKWFGPSPTSVICSDHDSTAEDFETRLHGGCGMWDVKGTQTQENFDSDENKEA